MPTIVEVKNVNVSRELYNMVRSFVESSTKELYTWNIGFYEEFKTEAEDGVPEPEKVPAIIRKVTFNKEGKWELVIEDITYKHLWGDKNELRITLLASEALGKSVVLDRDNMVINDGVDSQLKVPLTYAELKRTRVIADVAYAKPITLYDVYDKMMVYLSSFREFCRKREEQAQTQAQTQAQAQAQ
jgi:hypothetical protein